MIEIDQKGINDLFWSYWVNVKTCGIFRKKSVAFSEYLNFTTLMQHICFYFEVSIENSKSDCAIKVSIKIEIYQKGINNITWPFMILENGYDQDEIQQRKWLVYTPLHKGLHICKLYISRFLRTFQMPT